MNAMRQIQSIRPCECTATPQMEVAARAENLPVETIVRRLAEGIVGEVLA